MSEAKPVMPEKRISQEHLREILRDSAVSAHGWFVGSEIPEGRKQGRSRFMTIWNAKPMQTYQSSPEVLGMFIARGITDVVTIQRPKKLVPTHRYKPDSAKADEPAVGISYEVSTEGVDSKFVAALKHKVGASREEWEAKFGYDSAFRYATSTHINRSAMIPPTKTFRMFFAMPDSDASEWLAAVQDDPQIVRDTVDLAMREELNASKTWDEDGVRPAYDDWQALNGGVSRIAIRDGMSKVPEESQIFEF